MSLCPELNDQLNAANVRITRQRIEGNIRALAVRATEKADLTLGECENRIDSIMQEVDLLVALEFTAKDEATG